MLQSPFHDIFNSSEHFLPAGSETHRHLCPGELLRPVRQKLLVGIGEFSLSPCPGNLLDFNPTINTIDTPHQVDQKHPITPQGNELEAAYIQLIIKRCRLTAATTDSFAIAAGNHINFEAFFPIAEDMAHFAINKTLEFIALI